MVEKNINRSELKKRTLTPDTHYYEYGDISYNYEAIKEFPLRGEEGLSRFLPLLPIKELRVQVERSGKKLGDTPLQRAKNLGNAVGLKKLWIKREDQNPTGCLKDRESAIVISAAIEKGIKSVYVVSSGNAALSTAAYARDAGISCTCYVPEKTSPEKLNLIKRFGGILITIPGFYEDVYRKVVDMNPPGWNVTTGQNEYRVEGDKTISYELFEQLKGNIPDVIITPSGNGGSLAGIWKGFVELKKIGLINKLPQMLSVQIKGAAPIAIALQNGKDFEVLHDINDSIAEGIVAEESYASPKAVAALRESDGYVIEVTDDEIKHALKTVIDLEGFIPEPTSAAVYAALYKLKCSPSSLIVAINTGDGEKMKDEVMRLINQI